MKIGISIVILIVSLLSFVGCESRPTSPLYDGDDWVVEEGYFFTSNVAKAQEQLPFDIVLPNNVDIKPMITGVLKDFISGNEYSIKSEYEIPVVDGKTGLVSIVQTNQPSIPNSQNNQTIYINDFEVIKWEGNFSLGHGFFFFFNDGHTYFKMEVYDVPVEEVIDMIKSMTEQLLNSNNTV